MDDLNPRLSRLAIAHISAIGMGNTDSIYRQYRAGAEARCIAFELEPDVAGLLFKSPCVYCLYQPRHHFNGIDRVDNKLGYTAENSVACCKWCNRAKGRCDVEDFKEWIAWVRYHSLAQSSTPAPVARKRVLRWHNTFTAVQASSEPPLPRTGHPTQ